uniref:TFIIIC_sub6 domain-containing protein n=1 Tax=Steinernema glaseri TaxID=37863 RepID=A0A1I7ZWL1_9BILA
MDLDEDDYEEITMVMQLDGVLDTSVVRENVQSGQCTVRRAGTAHPVVQMGKSLYSAEWVQTMGTDLILKSNEQHQLELVSVSGVRMNAEKALASAPPKDAADPEAPKEKERKS